MTAGVIADVLILTHSFVLNYFSQISIHALTYIAHHLEFVRLLVLMTLAVFATRIAPPIRIQCVLRMEQHTTTNVGTS